VKWVGYGDEDNSWVGEEDLEDVENAYEVCHFVKHSDLSNGNFI
jgi:hypothetical protein